MTDKPRGLNPDFSDDVVRARVIGQTSGLSPHERPGHHAPNPQTDRDLSAKAGVAAVRQQNLDDGIPHT